MPLFLFIFLGLLQLGLAHQARLMARYAAYKGTRAGALQRANHDAMEKAALAAWLPMAGRNGTPSFYKVGSAGEYAVSWGLASSNQQGGGVRTVRVTICNPLSSDLTPNQDFDDPQIASGAEDWVGFTRTRLHAQFLFNYRLVVPFANGVLFYSALGSDLHNKEELMYLLRARNRKGKDQGGGAADALQALLGQANQGNYFLPIRSNYAMRLQSNVAQGTLPGSNNCRVPWDKGSDRKSQGNTRAKRRTLDTYTTE